MLSGSSSLPAWYEYARSALYREIRDVYWGVPKHLGWFIMRKLARFESMKALVNYLRCRATPLDVDCNLSQPEDTIFPGTDINYVIDCLTKDGLYLGLDLPESVVQQIVQFANDTPCYGNGKSYFGFYYHEKAEVSKKIGKEFSIADYFNTYECDAIQMIIKDPVLLQIARRYLGGSPVHQGTRLRWSFRNDSSEFEKYRYNQTFHYDVDDYCAMKFFFYLTEVQSGDGPHMCIVGSHKSKKFLHKILRGHYHEKNVLNFYKSRDVKSIYGNPGCGFVEDIFIMHKGLKPVNNDRLLLIIEFALKDYGMQHDRIEESRLKCHGASPAASYGI